MPEGSVLLWTADLKIAAQYEAKLIDGPNQTAKYNLASGATSEKAATHAVKHMAISLTDYISHDSHAGLARFITSGGGEKLPSWPAYVKLLDEYRESRRL